MYEYKKKHDEGFHRPTFHCLRAEGVSAQSAHDPIRQHKTNGWCHTPFCNIYIYIYCVRSILCSRSEGCEGLSIWRMKMNLTTDPVTNNQNQATYGCVCIASSPPPPPLQGAVIPPACARVCMGGRVHLFVAAGGPSQHSRNILHISSRTNLVGEVKTVSFWFFFYSDRPGRDKVRSK